MISTGCTSDGPGEQDQIGVIDETRASSAAAMRRPDRLIEDCARTPPSLKPTRAADRAEHAGCRLHVHVIEKSEHVAPALGWR